MRGRSVELWAARPGADADYRVTGGIDLSVGSMMGLAAVVFGAAARARFGRHRRQRWRCSSALAASGLNAVAVARLGIPPLIATLARYRCFVGSPKG